MDEKGTHFLSGKRIIVAGAGIAGLSFVRAMEQNWPTGMAPPRITVYERDARHLPGNRGNYSLGLRSDSHSGGLQALQKLGLIDEIYNARIPGSTGAMEIRDANWDTIIKVKKESTPPDGLPIDHMRITRNNLRECLVQSISDRVDFNWGTSCVTAATLKDGSAEVALDDGSISVCDLLVIADGASSKLRRCLRPDDDLKYAGAVIIGGNATFPDGLPQKLREASGPVIGGNGRALVCFQLDDKSMVWFLTRRSTEPRQPMKGEEAMAIRDEILAEVLSEGDVFVEPFNSIVRATDPSSWRIFNAMDKQPKPYDGGPYIFLGDSSHAVSPFAGNGANLALMDGLAAVDLCRACSVGSGMEQFERASFPRAKKSIGISHMVVRLAHATGLLYWLATMFLRLLNMFSR